MRPFVLLRRDTSVVQKGLLELVWLEVGERWLLALVLLELESIEHEEQLLVELMACRPHLVHC
jgi:hypothetical protein